MLEPEPNCEVVRDREPAIPDTEMPIARPGRQTAGAESADAFALRLQRSLAQSSSNTKPSEPSAPEPEDRFRARLEEALQTTQRDAAHESTETESPALALPDEADEDLRRLVDSWPQLPATIRALVMTMIDANPAQRRSA